ncbi:MAG TPA: hypothetical protein VFE78_37830 [Gemmataceae bacterium]|jgi:hypothetical protein|nr:hypothetical protein [Gemmataceae bacterium]
MTNNWVARRTPLSLLGAAAVLGAAGAVGLWSWLARGGGVQAPLAAAALAGAVLLGIVWQRHARATRRWNAAVNAYAEREIARARRFAVPTPSRGLNHRRVS